MDRRTRFTLEQALGGFTSGTDGRMYLDLEAAAIYRLEPPGSECVAVACLACHMVTIRPGSPTMPTFTVNCSSCGVAITCRPPAEVLAFGALGITIAAPRPPRRPH